MQRTAIVTGAGRGFGRAIADGLAADGWRVVGVSRTAADLDDARFTVVSGDATDEILAAELLIRHRPDLLVLNAGAVPSTAPLHEQDWSRFSENWNTDTRHVFSWVRAALRQPLSPGSTVLSMSSGAALHGSPLSGGYAGAKAMIGFIGDYAAVEADRMNLGIRFVTLYPVLTPTGVGAAGVSAYAARQGVDEATFVDRLQPVLTAELVAASVIELAAAPEPAPSYVLAGAGHSVLNR